MNTDEQEHVSSSRRRHSNGAHLPVVAEHDTLKSVCGHHHDLSRKVDQVRKTQKWHSFGMWAVGIIVAVVGIAVPAITAVQVARMGHDAGAIERKLDQVLSRLH